jgi:hypothetical protein
MWFWCRSLGIIMSQVWCQCPYHDTYIHVYIHTCTLPQGPDRLWPASNHRSNLSMFRESKWKRKRKEQTKEKNERQGREERKEEVIGSEKNLVYTTKVQENTAQYSSETAPPASLRIVTVVVRVSVDDVLFVGASRAHPSRRRSRSCTTLRLVALALVLGLIR